MACAENADATVNKAIKTAFEWTRNRIKVLKKFFLLNDIVVGNVCSY